jgi:hypothetical protein
MAQFRHQKGYTMPTLIPDSMPADWLDDGAEASGTTPDDTALRTAMQTAYREGLDRLGVAGIMGSLKDLCMEAASTKPQEDAEPETAVMPPPVEVT